MPIPETHTYEDGAVFSAYIGDAIAEQNIPGGEYAAKFAFADGEYNPDNVEYLDITNSKCVKDIFYKYNPDFIVNCAAYTNVDKAEVNKKKAHSVNVEGLQNILK